MKIKMNKIMLTCFALVVSSSTLFGGPVNDSDLPSLMRGEAFEASASSPHVTILDLNEEIKLDSASNITCPSSSYMKLTTAGNIFVDDKKVSIDGICLNGRNGKIEYVGEYNRSEVRLKGTVSVMDDEVSLKGRLKIRSLRFVVSMSNQ